MVHLGRSTCHAISGRERPVGEVGAGLPPGFLVHRCIRGQRLRVSFRASEFGLRGLGVRV